MKTALYDAIYHHYDSRTNFKQISCIKASSKSEIYKLSTIICSKSEHITMENGIHF